MSGWLPTVRGGSGGWWWWSRQVRRWLSLECRCGSGSSSSCLLIPCTAGRAGCGIAAAVCVLVDWQRCRVLWQALWHLRRSVPALAHPHCLRAGCGAKCGSSGRNTTEPSAIPAHLPHPTAESTLGGGTLSSVWEAVDAAAFAGTARSARTAASSCIGAVLCTLLVIRTPYGLIASVVSWGKGLGREGRGREGGVNSLVKRKASDLMYYSYIQMFTVSFRRDRNT